MVSVKCSVVGEMVGPTEAAPKKDLVHHNVSDRPRVCVSLCVLVGCDQNLAGCCNSGFRWGGEVASWLRRDEAWFRSSAVPRLACIRAEGATDVVPAPTPAAPPQWPNSLEIHMHYLSLTCAWWRT
jgi:hypothetical protein